MDKFTPTAPCTYHGLLKPGAKYTNVIYNNKSIQHIKQQPQQQSQHHKVNGHGEAPKTVEPIWDIVSGLAQALNDAKDQLTSLMQSRSNSPQKIVGNGNSCVNSHGGLSALRNASPRCYSAPHRRGRARGPQNGYEEEDHDPYSRNIHRSHAHGYCAFGRNSEFKEKMHHSSGRRIQSSPACGGGRGGGQGGANGGRMGDEGMPRSFPGNYGIKLQGGSGACGIKVIPNSKSYMCRRDRGKEGLHLQARMKNCDMNVDTYGEKFGPGNPVKLHFSTPIKVRYPSPNNRQLVQNSAEVKRYCVGTQYANLLREEAHHLREKRIREESKILKSHC
ncbi:unnamed protein product [Calypogeia fissa]